MKNHMRSIVWRYIASSYLYNLIFIALVLLGLIMFFDIIEPGIWFEKHLIETGSHYNWPTQKTIDIELDDQTVIELCQLEEPDAEQRGLLERQVRFLMDD